VTIAPFPPRRRIAPWLAAVALIAPAAAPGQGPQAPAVKTRTGARAVPETLGFANSLYRERRYDLAAEQYELFLRSARVGSEADAADALFGLGNARLFLGKYKEARQAFEEFARQAPEHPHAATGRYRIGETAYVLNDLPAARKNLEAYTASPSADRRYLQAAWSHLGDVDFRLGDTTAARRAYESALAGNPQGSLASRARLGLGRVLAARDETGPALGVLRDLAATGGPDWADKAWREAGRIEAAAGHWAEAAAAFEELEKAAPRSPLVAEARLDRAEALGHLDRRDEAEALLRSVADDPAQPLAAQATDALGASLLARGKPAEALAALDGAAARLASSPSASSLRFRAAEAELALGHPDEARARFLKLAEDDPEAPSADDALLRAATLALDARDPATAHRLAGSFAGRFPASPLRADARLVDARAALAAGRPKDAIAILRAATAGDRPAPAVEQASLYYLGLAYGKDGQPEKAAEVLAGLAKAPTPVAADAQYMLGQADFDAGRFAEAIPALEKYLADRPGGDVADHALARIAQAQAALGRPDEADAALARLAEKFPGSPTLAPTRSRLAESALAAGQFDRAAGLFRAVAEAGDPTHSARARSGLGWSLLRGGHPAEAADAFGALIEATPDDPLAPEAALARGWGFDQAKRPDDALAAYALTVEKYSRSPQAGPAALAMARLQVASKKPEAAAQTYALVARDHAQAAGEPLDAILSEWGWALIDAGKATEADVPFLRLIEEFPDSPKAPDARYNLAVSTFAARDFDRTIALLGPITTEKSAARAPLVRSALNLLGRARAERGDPTGALAAFDRLIADDPDGTFRREARFWKAEVAFKSGDAAAAEAGFAALAAEPPAGSDFQGMVATARARRAQCLAQLGKWAPALVAADATRADEPDNPLGPEVDFARGRSLLGLARFDESREAFDRVLAARKGTDLAARAQLMRGETYFHQQNYKEALLEFYRVILRYDAPEWQAAALLEAGKVHEKLDQWREAAESYEKLRKQFPADRNAEEAGRRLEAARRRAARPTGSDDARTR